MVIDCIYYNGEKSVLDLRIALLAPYVDRFVILEFPCTFSGFKKTLKFPNHDLYFAQWSNNISYFIGSTEFTEEDVLQAKNSPNTGNGEAYWMEEFMQKEHLQKCLATLNLSDDDLVFISDADEIWNPEILTLMQGDGVYKPRQLPYLYYLNNRTDEDWMGWTGTVATKYKNVKDTCINHLRTDSMTDYEVIENGGWHFNAIGGKEAKKDAFLHPVYENESEWDRREVNMRRDESDLPIYILNNKEQWKKLLLA